MKKLTKIVLGVILSVAMVVTGGLAFSNLNNAYAKTSIEVVGVGTVSTESSGASVDYGSYKQLHNDNYFTGVRLTGKTGAYFNLGTIDISKSNWAGTKNTVVAGNNNSFLELVFDPHDTDQDLRSGVNWTGELSYVQFQFTQGNTTLTLRVRYYNYSNSGKDTDVSNEYTVGATISNNLEDLGCYRLKQGDKTLTTLQSGVRKGNLNLADATALGYAKSGHVFSSRGDATYAIPFYYDFDDVALYTPGTFPATGLDDNYLIRDFDSTEPVENKKKTITTWSGFTKNGNNGEVLVDVKATFGTVYGDSPSSIVITKLGDYNLNANATLYNNDAKVLNVAGVNGSAKLGTYAQSVSGKEYTGINLTGAKGTTFNLGTMSINDTYFDKDWRYDNSQGVINSKESKGKYTGTNFVDVGEGADTRSFIDFVINPNADGVTLNSKTVMFTITLTEVGKPENFVTYHITNYSDKEQELQVLCSATNNVAGQERFYYTNNQKIKIGNLTDGLNVRRSGVYIGGDQDAPISLYFDATQNAAYTNYAYNGDAEGIHNAFRIRDFDAVTENESDYQPLPTGIKSWGGFSENANVEVTLTMGEMYNKSTLKNSVIITSLFGYKFNDVNLTTVDKVTYFAGEDYDLGKVVINNTKTISYKVNGAVLDTLKYYVNGADSERVATSLNSGDKITVYDANDVQIGGAVTVTTASVDATITANAKSITHKETPYNSGDTIKGVLVGDTITIAPKGLEIKTKTPYESNIILSDVRTADISGSIYEYNTVYKQSTAPFVYDEVNKVYTYVVDANDIVDGKLNISVVFDRYCKITIQDEYVADKVIYKWTDEKYDWDIAKTVFNDVKYGNSKGDKKVVMGYARKDIGIDINTSKEIVRGDGFTYNYGAIGSLYYTNISLGDVSHGSVDTDNKIKAYTIIPDMVIERIYIGVEVTNEIQFETDPNDINTVNEERSGLRFVVKVNKADFAKYKHYSVDTNNKGLSTTNFYHYFTTKSQLDKVGYKGTLTAIGTKWMTNGWDAELGKTNGLGLTCISLNGKKPEGAVTGTGGFGFIKRQESSTNNMNNMWHNNITSVDYNKYLAYAITFHSFKDASQTYVMSLMTNAGYMTGGSTGLMCEPIEICLKDLCADKYTKNLLTAAPESGTSYGFKIGEVTYYSTLTRAHMQWLATKAGLDVTLEELPKPTVEA